VAAVAVVMAVAAVAVVVAAAAAAPAQPPPGLHRSLHRNEWSIHRNTNTLALGAGLRVALGALRQDKTLYTRTRAQYKTPYTRTRAQYLWGTSYSRTACGDKHRDKGAAPTLHRPRRPHFQSPATTRVHVPSRPPSTLHARGVRAAFTLDRPHRLRRPLPATIHVHVPPRSLFTRLHARVAETALGVATAAALTAV